MSVRNHRPAVVGVIAAAAIALPVAALASNSNSPSPPKPAHSHGADRQAAKSSAAAGTGGAANAGRAAKRAQIAPGLQTLASSAGISVSRLQAGLMAVKRAGGDSAAGIAAFASSAGVSNATARRVVHAVFGNHGDLSLTGSAAVAVLASRLGISRSAAHRAMHRISALSGRGGMDPASPAFAAIAHDLGVSPVKLAAALDAVKQSMARN